MMARRESGRWRLHLALCVGLSISLIGFAVELRRGLAGNLPAWVYVAEWPFFGACGAYLWWRLLHDDEEALNPADDERVVVHADDNDPGLTAWRDYVARLEAEAHPEQH